MSETKTLRLEHSPLTDNVYAVTSRSKHDVTNDFIFCVLSRWTGFQQTVRNRENGKAYQISVREVVKHD